ncbi:MAG: dihydroorotase family protein [Candidatus Thorarchaeota archaeon]|nr:MAG: dihydroorotase family protein [Candidatus Thorarchaeota archaeon]
MSSSVTASWRKRRMSRSVDLVVRDARLLLESGLVRGGIGVSDGVIVVIASDEHLPSGERVIEAGGKILMPGLIDGHAHIYDPDMKGHEDFTSGSRAAAAGGVTTIIDMPLVSQVASTKEADHKISEGLSKSIVDFSLNAGMLNSDNTPVIPLLIERGIAAFKAFMCEPFYANNGVITQAMSEVSEHGGHITLHAEDQGVLDEFAKEMEGEWDAPISHSLSRPNLAEQLAIGQAVRIAEKTGGHLHLAHVTTREGLHEVERAKLHGVTVSSEVCPHHLMFHRDEMNILGPKSKMNPPLRAKEDRAALWSAILRGVIDTAVSDHAPCPIEEKDEGSDDIRNAWSGVDGIQMILRVLLSEGINRGRLSYTRLLNIASRRPAKIFGIYPKKGVLQVGSDADFVIVDPTREEKITSEIMFSKCGWTLYDRRTMTGVPIMTFVRGVSVYESGSIQANPGHGEFLRMGGGGLNYEE